MTTGDTDKPLMLLLHGFPELWTMWENQMSAFRDKYNVAAIDMRGYGRSDRPAVRSTNASQKTAPCRTNLATAVPSGTLCQAATNEGKTAEKSMPWLCLQARRDYYIDVLVEDVVAVVHGLGYQKCVLAGHDWCAIQEHMFDQPCLMITCG